MRTSAMCICSPQRKEYCKNAALVGKGFRAIRSRSECLSAGRWVPASNGRVQPCMQPDGDGFASPPFGLGRLPAHLTGAQLQDTTDMRWHSPAITAGQGSPMEGYLAVCLPSARPSARRPLYPTSVDRARPPVIVRQQARPEQQPSSVSWASPRLMRAWRVRG